MKPFGQTFYSSNIGSTFDMVYQILQGGGKQRVNVGGLQEQITNTLLMTKKTDETSFYFMLFAFLKMSNDYLKTEL